jgi:hypothetical protein
MSKEEKIARILAVLEELGIIPLPEPLEVEQAANQPL